MQIHKIDEWPNLVLWRSPSTSLRSHRPRLLLDLGSVPTQVTQVPSFILATLHCHFLLKFDICHAFVTLILGHRGSFYWAPKWPNTWDLAFIFRLSTVSRPQIHNPAALSSIYFKGQKTHALKVRLVFVSMQKKDTVSKIFLKINWLFILHEYGNRKN